MQNVLNLSVSIQLKTPQSVLEEKGNHLSAMRSAQPVEVLSRRPQHCMHSHRLQVLSASASLVHEQKMSVAIGLHQG